MRIVIDIEDEKAKQFIEFIKTLDYVKIKKQNNIKNFVGVWKNKDVSIENIREKAWKR